MTTPSPTSEVPLPEPDGEEYVTAELSHVDVWREHSVRSYADARTAHAVEQERAWVVAWLETVGARHEDANRGAALLHAADAIERGDHLPTEES